MNSFDIVPFGSGVSIKAQGSTRAGLMVAAVKGVIAATESRATDVSAPEIERAFALTAKSFGTLISAVVTQLLTASQEHGEAYNDVKFTLITDKEAKGAFVARPGKMDSPMSLSRDEAVDPDKNPEGMWEVDLVLI